MSTFPQPRHQRRWRPEFRKLPSIHINGRQYGIVGEVHPFVPRPDHPADVDFIRSEMNVVIIGVEDMIYHLVRKRLPIDLCEDDVDEIVQQTRIAIMDRFLPKYNSTSGAKLSTFLFSCINNFLTSAMREHVRASRRRPELAIDPEHLTNALQAVDDMQDQHILELAEDMRNNPEKYFTKKQAAVFRSLASGTDRRFKDIADNLKYRQASSFSMMFRRIMDRIREISIEDGVKEDAAS